ncbi:MAG: hypothetical protein NW207_08570 [Cytophagales bacterium]|nr:hypothetical protein [Cytophagales bacterium]
MSIFIMIKKKFGFSVVNCLACMLMIWWLFRECIDINSSFTIVALDFVGLLVCIFSFIRMRESMNGMYKVLDMCTIYYASIFFMFFWFIRLLVIGWNIVYRHESDMLELVVVLIIFINMVSVFVHIEKENFNNLDKIEQEY